MADFSPLLSVAKGEVALTFQEALAQRSLITPYDYQEEAIAAVKTEWDTLFSTMIVLPMGTGKTECVLGTVQNEIREGRFGRAIIIAHTEELIFQPVTRILRNWELPCPGIVMADWNMVDAPIIAATVQSLSASKMRRMDEIVKYGMITHLIIDECHHSVSSNYQKVVTYLTEHNPNLRILGVTATPRRADQDGLAKNFQSVAYRMSLNDAIKRELLCPFEGKIAQMGFTLDGIKSTKDGWDNEAVGDLMSSDNALEVVYQKWEEEAFGLPTVAFTDSVKQARRMAEYFQSRGVRAAYVSGGTPRAERRDILSAYMNKELDVIMNCQLLTEGWDAKHTACVIMAKCTKSPVLYSQCIGRGLRKYSGKQKMTLLQFVPMEAPIDLFMVGDLLGKPKAQQKREAKAAKEGIILDVFGIGAEGEGDAFADPDEVVMQTLDFFSRRHGNKKMNWAYDPVSGVGALALDRERTIGIIPAYPDVVEQVGEVDEKYERWVWFTSNFHLFELSKGRMIRHGSSESFDEIEAMASEMLSRASGGIVTKGGEWQKQPPSEAQVKLARKLNVYKLGMTKGETAKAITLSFFLREVEKRGWIPQRKERVSAN